MSAGANPDIVTGTWVDVHYRAQLGNYQWWERKFTAKFMGQEGDKVFFSMRPLAGTQDLSAKDIISIQPAQIHKPSYGTNVRKLPKQD